MGKKYSKNRLKLRNIKILLISVLVLIILVSIVLSVYLRIANNIVYENINNDSLKIDENVAVNSTPILINNVIIGGVYSNKWVSLENYYHFSKNKADFEIDIFTRRGKSGNFKLNEPTLKEDKLVYATTTATNYTDEYFGVAVKTTNISKLDEINLNDNNIQYYKEYVKKALGLYGKLNNTIKIREVYEVYINPGEISYIITATNDGKTNKGVYSSVIYVDNFKNSSLVKYNYIKNINKATDFSMYTLKFVADLNGDKKAELILQETKEFSTKYSIMESINNKFYEVLSVTLNN